VRLISDYIDVIRGAAQFVRFCGTARGIWMGSVRGMFAESALRRMPLKSDQIIEFLR
jgi:hypothetical protein